LNFILFECSKKVSEKNEDNQAVRKMLRALLSCPVPSEKNFNGGMCLFSTQEKEKEKVTVESVKKAYGVAWDVVLRHSVSPEDLKKVIIISFVLFCFLLYL